MLNTVQYKYITYWTTRVKSPQLSKDLYTGGHNSKLLFGLKQSWAIYLYMTKWLHIYKCLYHLGSQTVTTLSGRACMCISQWQT